MELGVAISGQGKLAVAPGPRRSYECVCSSSTRGVWLGGINASFAASNVIDYVTIASAGNATDFGDLTASTDSLAGCSNDHGGL